MAVLCSVVSMLTDPAHEAAADAMSTDSESDVSVDAELMDKLQKAEKAVAEDSGSYDAHLEARPGQALCSAMATLLPFASAVKRTDQWRICESTVF